MTKQKSKAAKLAAEYRRKGFDKTHVDRETGYIAVQCSQCEAGVICGHPCHETG